MTSGQNGASLILKCGDENLEKDIDQSNAISGNLRTRISWVDHFSRTVSTRYFSPISQSVGILSSFVTHRGELALLGLKANRPVSFWCMLDEIKLSKITVQIESKRRFYLLDYF